MQAKQGIGRSMYHGRAVSYLINVPLTSLLPIEGYGVGDRSTRLSILEAQPCCCCCCCSAMLISCHPTASQLGSRYQLTAVQWPAGDVFIKGRSLATCSDLLLAH